jgi:hypothetical protein
MRERGCPECRWVAVVDEAGRRRFEMRWQKRAVAADEQVARAA